MKTIMYHYCNMNAFFNIIRTKTIWLSDAFKTNDMLELRWIFESLTMPRIDSDIETFKLDYEYWSKVHFRPHIACFSLEGDILSQWRGYADDGRGVSIGFNQEYFERISKMENKETIIRKVIYGADEQKRILKKLMDEINIEEFHLLNKDFKDIASSILAGNILEQSMVFKHYSFEEEKEIRLIHACGELAAESDCIKYRNTADDLISYIDIPLSVDNGYSPITKIILGPKNKADIQHIKEYVETTLGTKKEIKVTRSESSYR